MIMFDLNLSSQHDGGVSSLKIEEETGLVHNFVWELFARWNYLTNQTHV